MLSMEMLLKSLMQTDVQLCLSTVKLSVKIEPLNQLNGLEALNG